MIFQRVFKKVFRTFLESIRKIFKTFRKAFHISRIMSQTFQTVSRYGQNFPESVRECVLDFSEKFLEFVQMNSGSFPERALYCRSIDLGSKWVSGIYSGLFGKSSESLSRLSGECFRDSPYVLEYFTGLYRMQKEFPEATFEIPGGHTL